MLGSEFWVNKHKWPSVTPTGYIFFPGAFEAFGRALFGPDWTGEEASFAGAGEQIPSASDVFYPDRDDPKNLELLREHQRQVFEILGLVGNNRSPTWDEWCEARTRWYDLELRGPKINARCEEVIQRMHEAAAAGLLIFTVRRRDGQMDDLKPAYWNCDSPLVRARFSSCAISARDPFETPPTIIELLIDDPEERARQWAYWESFKDLLFIQSKRLDAAIELFGRHDPGEPISEAERSFDMPPPAPDENGKPLKLTEITEPQPCRPKGAGEFVHTDEAFIDEMRRLIEAKEVGSIKAAAYRQWPACGGASIEAAEKRLRRKYRVKYRATDISGQ